MKKGTHVTPWLRLKFNWWRSRSHLWLCKSDITELFEIASDVKRIRLHTTTKRPKGLKGVYGVKVVSSWGRPLRWFLLGKGKNNGGFGYWLQLFVKKHYDICEGEALQGYFWLEVDTR